MLVYFVFFPAKRHIILPHPRPVLLRASILPPVKASTSPLLTQGLKLCLNPCLSIQHPLLLALHLQLLLQRPILSHLENLLPLLPIMATSMRPYPPRQTAPKAPMGSLQLHRRLAEVGKKQWIHHRPEVRQQGLKEVEMLRSNTSPSPVLEAMKDNPPETGRETDCTLTGAETGRDTTGTGVRSEKVTVIVIGTGGTTEITNAIIARTGIVCLLMIVTTGTGSLSVAGRGLSTTPGSAIATGALTITTTITTTGPERTWTVSGGDMVIPTARSLTVAGGGRRRVENPGGRTRATAGRGTITRQKRRLPRPPRCRKPPRSPRARPLGLVSPRLNQLQTGRIKITRGLLILRARRGRTALRPATLKNTKRARKRRSRRIKTGTVRAGE